jgi:SNF2 family DNA or RNA helicase
MEMKRSRVTDELLNGQSENIFTSKNSVQKGLQQYFTPTKIAQFASEVIEADNNAVIVDLTAGTGNLLKPYSDQNDSALCLGIELDKSNIPTHTENLKVANADLSKVYPYLKAVDFKADIVALNPPFSLFWELPELTGNPDKKIESQKATILIGYELLSILGAGYFIASRSTFEKSLNTDTRIMQRVFATIHMQNLFLPYSNVESTLCFFSNDVTEKHIEKYVSSIDFIQPDIDAVLEKERDQLHRFIDSKRVYIITNNQDEEKKDKYERFRAALAEYKRQQSKKSQTFNIEIKNGKFSVSLSNYQYFIINTKLSEEEQSLINEMKGVALSYFAFNTQARKLLTKVVEQDKLLTISPNAEQAIEKAIQKADFTLTPFYSLKPQQRLAHLENIDQIKCTKDLNLKKKSFKSGKLYPVKVTTTIATDYYERMKFSRERERDEKTEMVKVSKNLSIEIDEYSFTESKKDIEAIIQHFELPDPKDIRAKKPELYTRLKSRLEGKEFERYTLKQFQIEDLSRLAMKESAVLSWEQGLGKTRGALAWSSLRDSRKVLIVVPQDLKKQWIAEAKVLGINIGEIKSYSDAKRISHLAPCSGEPKYFIIHYELLKGTRQHDQLKHSHVDPQKKYCPNCKSIKAWNGYVCSDCEFKNCMDETNCPNCGNTRNEGWNGKTCKQCSFTLYDVRVKGMYTLLKKAFDTIIVDEGVKIKSKDSLQGIAVRSLHAKNRLLLSGSPIKGWITDAFWLLHWTLGNASARFPYHYKGGTEKFLDDFGVFEYTAEEFRKSLSKGKRKLLPEISNLSLLWKLFAPSIIRRKKVETGEVLVDKHIHKIKLNFTQDQKRVYDWWIANFSDWFESTHKSKFCGSQIEFMKAILGQLWKLRLSATVPASELLRKDEQGEKGCSNFTEKTLFIARKVNEIISANEQIVIFTALQDYGEFLQELFLESHIGSRLVNGNVNPRKRSEVIDAFKQGEFPILIAGTEAVNLGHNLDNANHIIMCDYIWEHSTTRQAIDRVHRLTSKKDVNVYLLYIENSIDEKQLKLIENKGKSSDLALDGELIDQDENEIDFLKIAKEILTEHDFTRNHAVPEQLIEKQVRSIFNVCPESEVEILLMPKEAVSLLEIEQLSLFAA